MVKVTAALIYNDGKLLIAKRKLSGKLPGKWEFPGGKLETGETPEDCLRRELKEELHIDTAIGDYFGESIYTYDHGTVQLMAYWVRWIGGHLTLSDHDEVQWVSVEELKSYDFAPADILFVEKLKTAALPV